MSYKEYPGDINEYIRTTEPDKIDLDYIVEALETEQVDYKYYINKEYIDQISINNIKINDKVIDLPNNIILAIISRYPLTITEIYNNNTVFYNRANGLDGRDAIVYINGRVLYLYPGVDKDYFDTIMEDIVEQYHPLLIVGVGQDNNIYYLSQEVLDIAASKNMHIDFKSLIYTRDKTNIYILIPGITTLSAEILKEFVDNLKPLAISTYHKNWRIAAEVIYTDKDQVYDKIWFNSYSEEVMMKNINNIVRLNPDIEEIHPILVSIINVHKPNVVLSSKSKILYINVDNIDEFVRYYDDLNNTVFTYLAQITPEVFTELLRKYPYVQEIRQTISQELIWRITDKQRQVTVKRGAVLKDYLDALINQNLWGSRCKFHFEGESGVDVGGLTNEAFSSISTELKNKFFVCKMNVAGQCYYMFPPNKENCYKELGRDESCYRYLGQLVAKSIKEKYIINIPFSHVILALLLGFVKEYNIESLLKYLRYDDQMFVDNLTKNKEYILANAEDYEIDNLIPTEANYDQYLEKVIARSLGVNMLDKSTYGDFVEGFHSIIAPRYTYASGNPKYLANIDAITEEKFKEINDLLIGIFS